MGLIDRLRLRLSNSRAAPIREASLEGLRAQEEALRAKLRGERSPPPPVDMVIEAVQLYRETLRIRNARHARILAAGCTQSLEDEGYRLIEDEARFPVLLEGIEDYLAKPRAFCDCFEGLVDAYFRYDPDHKDSRPAGTQNWALLRGWLARHREQVRIDEGIEPPAWVSELQRHPEVFTEKPYGRFGREILSESDEDYKRFRAALNIETGSWFIERLVIGQILAADESASPGFMHYLPKLVKLVEEVAADKVHLGTSRLFNQALALLLMCYEKQPAHPPQPELRDLAVLHWGRPSKKIGVPEWALVEPEVRQMVSSWVNLHCIEYFFEALSQDGVSDPRRLKFWSRYHAAIDNVLFALGPAARGSRDSDMVEARRLLGELMVDLQAGGPASNNAFIMQFGPWVVVEFGQKGNACFFFTSSDLPFKFGDPLHAPTVRSHIADESHSHLGAVRKTHRDRNDGRWETTFERVLNARTIYPGASPLDGRTARAQSITYDPAVGTVVLRNHSHNATPMQQVETRPSASGSFQRFPTHGSKHGETGNDPTIKDRQAGTRTAQGVAPGWIPPTPVQNRRRLSPSEVRRVYEFCRERSIQYRDRLGSNGNFWVYADEEDDPYIAPQLREWGFTYRAGEGWWYKDNE